MTYNESLIRESRHKDYIRYVRLRRCAHLAVQRAIESGELMKPDNCSRCGKKASKAGSLKWVYSSKDACLYRRKTTRIEAHHRSYNPEHWLEVEWLCNKCHRRHH